MGGVSDADEALQLPRDIGLIALKGQDMKAQGAALGMRSLEMLEALKERDRGASKCVALSGLAKTLACHTQGCALVVTHIY